jgi:phosphate transport system substrate-binding protein
MKKKIRGIFSLLIVCIFVAGAFGACSNKSENDSTSGDVTATQTPATDDTDTTDAGTGDTTEDLSGAIAMAGSTSMEKIANAAAEGFMAKYPNVTISPEFTGSGAGLEALIAGTIDIGNSSRNLTDDEKASGAVENIICLDGIAVVVDTANTVTNLTKDQLTQIFTGAVTNWKDLGGADQPIVVVGRESGSGTRGAFEELLEIQDLCKYSNEINSTGGVLAKVASTPGAIGYVSLDIVDDTVSAVSLEGVEPTVENIKAGTYFLQRPFVMATMGEISEQSELVQAFFEYLKSDEGKELIQSVGLITID